MSQKPEIFVTPQIYFPKLFTAVSKTVPHIEMTAKEAVAAGYSFRKKRRSIKITNYHGKPHKNHIIPYLIDGMPVDELGREAFRNCTCCIMHIHGNIRRLGEAVFKGSTMYKVIFEDGLTSLSDYLFSECRMLEQAELPLTLKHIGYRSFIFCKGLKYIEFPKSICEIENQAFYASGLEDFAVECLTPGINNADAFEAPLMSNNQVICTYPDPSNLTVLHVRGGPFKFKADSVTFCRWSLHSDSMDLSECKTVRFYRNAVRAEKPRDKEHMSYGVSPCTIILPEHNDCEQHCAFPKHVTGVNYFPQKDRLYKKPYEIGYDSKDDTCIITPVADFFPHHTIQEDCEKIVVKGRVHIDRNAVNCRNLKEITFEDFCPEDRIFSLHCRNLRKVSFDCHGRKVTRFIPNMELTSWDINKMLLMTFTPCAAPCGNGFRRTFYNREIIDSFFQSEFVSSDDNQWVKLLHDSLYQAGWIHNLSYQLSFRVTSKIKAVIAVDVLRSDRLDHEPPGDMYADFLRTHRSFCRQYFTKISGRYPEYLAAFEQIMQCSGNA